MAPRAFVIMPFAEGFNEVYNLFIADTLSRAGYEVIRADDIRAQQNILKDIVLGIAQSNLIVADLTDSNPNVYYELGIAHALQRPVILLTQQLSELPFDLQSYRVITYSTHFAEIERARELLLELAEGATAGAIPFGNPVSDFLGGLVPPAASDSEGEAGLLDHLVAIEDGFSELTEIVGQFGAETEQIGSFTTLLSGQLPGLGAREARALVIGFAQKLTRFAEQIGSLNARYTGVLGQLRTALEFILRAQSPSTEDEVSQLRSFVESLSVVEQSAAQGRASHSGLAEILRGLPNVERSFGRARARAVREVERFAENLEQTVATAARAREIGDSKLATRTVV